MSKSKPSKKAELSSTFTYIFALVVGAIILVFFIRFAIQAEKGGTELVKAEVLQSLDSSLQAFSVSTYSTDVLPKPPWPQVISLRFGTKANCGKAMIEGQKYFAQIPRIIYGPEEMKGKQLQAWTISWHFPFRVANFFFLTNDRSLYYLMPGNDNKDFVRSISSTQQAWEYKLERLPKELRVSYTETEPSQKPAQADMIKINYFKPVSKAPNNMKGAYIKMSNECKDENEPNYRCFGTAEFYDGSKNTGTTTFLGREMMFGAIMASTIEEYECQHKRALDELERMTDVYTGKAEKLKTKKAGCEDKYQFMIERLNKMKQDISSLRTNPDSESMAAELSNDAKNIGEYNSDSLGGYQDCEILF